MSESFLSRFQTQHDAFRGIVADDVFRLRSENGAWQFGSETISIAAQYFLQRQASETVIQVGLVNEPSLTATWYKMPSHPNAFVIGVNVGLVEALRLIASDVFGYGDEEEGEPLRLGTHDKAAADRVSERVAAFLEIGYPLGNAINPSVHRRPFVNAIVEDATQFLVLHEFAHILLAHDRGDVRLLRNRMVDLQIATFSIGQEHQADRLAARLHASMRRKSAEGFPGLEFVGPTLFFGVLGLFERYGRYQAVFDSPHAHPYAYERLYRLRVDLSAGDGHMYWSIPEGDGVKLARLDLDANPEAVKFADAVAKSLLSVLEQVEEREALPSPFTDIFNRFTSNEISDIIKEEFWREIGRWLFLGSPIRVVQHLVEAQSNIDKRLSEPTLLNEDRLFLERSKILINDTIQRMSLVQDYSVQKALRERVC